jgi:two-component system nitrogen regulation response regulator GlnG
MPSLLVIDDEPNILYSLTKSLRSETLDVVTASMAREGLEWIQRSPPDAVLLDVRLADMSGLDTFDRIRQLVPRLPVIFITAHAATETAIEATKRGAFEFLLKPLDYYQLRAVVAKAIELSRLRRMPAVFADHEFDDEEAVDRIVGRNPAMQSVFKAIGRVAPLDVPVLILGESGCGKELVARALYQHSQRSQGPFLTINCAAIPEALLESELFGHEKGAFTGADRRHISKFEQVNHGTIFLDEIGDLSIATQPKVLRLLQEQQFERVGGNETIQTDVRVIAATNQDLETLLATGQFRQDLFYRLKVFIIRLPPLRERLDDLPLLVEHFLKILNRGLGKKIRAVAPETLHLLQAHDWPGNVRELQSALKHALVQAVGEVLTPDCLPENLRVPAEGQPPSASPLELTAADRLAGSLSRPEEASETLDVGRLVAGLLEDGEADIYRRAGLAVDRVVLNVVLSHVKGNQVRASELLGISRTTLRAKLRSLGMTIEKQVLPEPNQPDERARLMRPAGSRPFLELPSA